MQKQNRYNIISAVFLRITQAWTVTRAVKFLSCSEKAQTELTLERHFSVVPMSQPQISVFLKRFKRTYIERLCSIFNGEIEWKTECVELQYESIYAEVIYHLWNNILS